MCKNDLKIIMNILSSESFREYTVLNTVSQITINHYRKVKKKKTQFSSTFFPSSFTECYFQFRISAFFVWYVFIFLVLLLSLLFFILLLPKFVSFWFASLRFPLLCVSFIFLVVFRGQLYPVLHSTQHWGRFRQKMERITHNTREPNSNLVSVLWIISFLYKLIDVFNKMLLTRESQQNQIHNNNNRCFFVSSDIYDHLLVEWIYCLAICWFILVRFWNADFWNESIVESKIKDAVWRWFN